MLPPCRPSSCPHLPCAGKAPRGGPAPRPSERGRPTLRGIPGVSGFTVHCPHPLARRPGPLLPPHPHPRPRGTWPAPVWRPTDLLLRGWLPRCCPARSPRFGFAPQSLPLPVASSPLLLPLVASCALFRCAGTVSPVPPSNPSSGSFHRFRCAFSPRAPWPFLPRQQVSVNTTARTGSPQNPAAHTHTAHTQRTHSHLETHRHPFAIPCVFS